MSEDLFVDYPAESVAEATPYHRCALCKVVSTEIKGRLSGHLPECLYRKNKEGEIAGNQLRELAVLAITELNKHDISSVVPEDSLFWFYFQQIQSKL